MLENGTIVEFRSGIEDDLAYRYDEFSGRRAIVVQYDDAKDIYLITFGSAYANYGRLHNGQPKCITKQKSSCWWCKRSQLIDVFSVEKEEFKIGDVVVYHSTLNTYCDDILDDQMDGVRGIIIGHGKMSKSRYVVEFGKAYYESFGLSKYDGGYATWYCDTTCITKVKKQEMD